MGCAARWESWGGSVVKGWAQLWTEGRGRRARICTHSLITDGAVSGPPSEGTSCCSSLTSSTSPQQSTNTLRCWDDSHTRLPTLRTRSRNPALFGSSCRRMRCSSCRRSAGIASRGFSSRLTRSGASRRSRKAAGRSRQLRGHPLPPVSSPRCKVRRSIGQLPSVAFGLSSPKSLRELACSGLELIRQTHLVRWFSPCNEPRAASASTTRSGRNGGRGARHDGSQARE